MTDAILPTGCNDTCSTQGSTDPSCGCSDVGNSRKSKPAKYVAGFIGLCAVCCAVPPLFVALGLISLSSAAYLGFGLKAGVVVICIAGLGYLAVRFAKRKV